MSAGWTIDPKSALPPIVIDPDAAATHRFCFMGEFGYEIVSWMPWLKFLKQQLGIPLRTMGRVGSSLFYEFSDDHIELTDPPGDCWGEINLYQRIAEKYPDEKLIHPGPEMVNRRTIVIGGFDWRNRDIHKALDTTHYAKLDFSHICHERPGIRPKVVINNKYFVQWPGLFSKPINFIDRESLIALRDLLTQRGYDVIYNHYVEKTAYDKHEALDDEGIFSGDLREMYAACKDVNERNRLQLEMYNSASFVIGPQGGNLYLPAVCGRDLHVIMRVGNYIDYPELARVYGGRVELFYEPKHMIAWLRQELPEAQQLAEAA